MNVNNKEKVYVVEEMNCDSDEGGTIIGYCDTIEKANEYCKKMESENESNLNLWNKHCINCICGCESFDSPTCKEAVEELDIVRSGDCPYAKDADIREIFYGKNNESGGFEIYCKHRVQDCSNYCYIASECRKLN